MGKEKVAGKGNLFMTMGKVLLVMSHHGHAGALGNGNASLA